MSASEHILRSPRLNGQEFQGMFVQNTNHLECALPGQLIMNKVIAPKMVRLYSVQQSHVAATAMARGRFLGKSIPNQGPLVLHSVFPFSNPGCAAPVLEAWKLRSSFYDSPPVPSPSWAASDHTPLYPAAKSQVTAGCPFGYVQPDQTVIAFRRPIEVVFSGKLLKPFDHQQMFRKHALELGVSASKFLSLQASDTSKRLYFLLQRQKGLLCLYCSSCRHHINRNAGHFSHSQNVEWLVLR